MGRLTNRQRERRAIRDKSRADKEYITSIYYNNPNFTIKEIASIAKRSEFFTARAIAAWLRARMERKQAAQSFCK